MLTMQEFYNKLTSDSRQKDPYWYKLTQLEKLKIEELVRFVDVLGWYVWFVPPSSGS